MKVLDMKNGVVTKFEYEGVVVNRLTDRVRAKCWVGSNDKIPTGFVEIRQEGDSWECQGELDGDAVFWAAYGPCTYQTKGEDFVDYPLHDLEVIESGKLAESVA